MMGGRIRCFMRRYCLGETDAAICGSGVTASASACGVEMFIARAVATRWLLPVETEKIRYCGVCRQLSVCAAAGSNLV